MVSLGAGESVAVVVGAGERGSATATLLAGAGSTVVAADRTPKAPDELARPHHTLRLPCILIRS